VARMSFYLIYPGKSSFGYLFPLVSHSWFVQLLPSSFSEIFFDLKFLLLSRCFLSWKCWRWLLDCWSLAWDICWNQATNNCATVIALIRIKGIFKKRFTERRGYHCWLVKRENYMIFRRNGTLWFPAHHILHI